MIRAISFAASALLSLAVTLGCETQNYEGEQDSSLDTLTSNSVRSARKTANQSTSCADVWPGSKSACSGDTEGADGTVRSGVDSITGKPLHAVGQKLAAAQLVSVSSLLRAPDSYVGKTVRVEGHVTAMCDHRRAWFAVQHEGVRDGGYVRVLTAPGFLVPSGTVGRRARTEGTVDVIEVPPAEARHYASEHALGDPASVRGAERRVILRATGAEFI